MKNAVRGPALVLGPNPVSTPTPCAPRPSQGGPSTGIRQLKVGPDYGQNEPKVKHKQYHQNKPKKPGGWAQRRGVRNEDDNQVNVDSNNESSQQPAHRIHPASVHESSHEAFRARKVQHGQKRKGELHALQNIQPLIEHVPGGRIGRHVESNCDRGA